MKITTATEAPAETLTERFDVVVIGAGQAGLSVGYHLKKLGLRFVILDASERIGDVWRKRWDSLRLFTPARFDGLDGMPFPGPPDAFPTKDEMGDYLEAYAARFGLPVRTGTRVDSLTQRGGVYVLLAGGRELEAGQVVVAMASYQRPRLPELAADLAPEIVQIHSSDYRSPAQLRPGGVLVVGAGNSGAEIGVELARVGHPTWMAGRDTGEVPFRINGLLGRLFLTRLVLRFLFHRVLSLRTPIGRRVRQKVIRHGGPLIRTRQTDLARAGIARVPRIAGVSGGRPLLEDGRILDVANVVWCTGFHPGFSWIDLPIFSGAAEAAENGEPEHDGGVVPSQPGLYFVGLHFLYAMSSTMIHGVGRDAARIAAAVGARAAEARLRPVFVRQESSMDATLGEAPEERRWKQANRITSTW
jgi:putative flavoprotein involved in K+ transport